MTPLLTIALALRLGCVPASAEPREVEPDSVFAIFARLREEAGIPATELGLDVAESDAVNGWYVGPKVIVSTGFLAKYGKDAPVLANVLGHEIGHALQARRGMSLRGKQAEADADAIGQQLAERAGYEPSELYAAARRFFAPDPALPPMSFMQARVSDHPMNEDRVVAMIAYKPAIDEYRMAQRLAYVRPDIFDEDGRARPHLLVEPEGKAALLASVRHDPFPKDPTKPASGNPYLQARAQKRLHRGTPPGDDDVDRALDIIIEPPHVLGKVRTPADTESVQRAILDGVHAASAGDVAWFKERLRREGLMKNWRDDTR